MQYGQNLYSMTQLSQSILNDERLRVCHARSYGVLKSGLNAGTIYPEVWIRDLATFIEISSVVGDRAEIRGALRNFFDFQQPGGAIIDGFTLREASNAPYEYIVSEKYPELVGHKNTVESDQESSLVTAVRKYVQATKDDTFIEELIGEKSVIDRLADALEWVYRERWNTPHGLAWNATTLDWGDIQPEHSWGVVLDQNSHPAISIYTNAMLSLALTDYVWLLERSGRETSKWEDRKAALREATRKHLWDDVRGKFKPHIYLGKGSPFPPELDEDEIFYHGGTAVAMLAGFLTTDEAKASYEWMKRNVRKAQARTVGLTLWPLYDVPSSAQPNYHTPFTYQNGGDWPWFGGRVSQGLIAAGLPDEAYESLLPIVEMVETHNGFYEWHSPDGTPHGAATFRGAAGVVGRAIEQLWDWASSKSFS